MIDELRTIRWQQRFQNLERASRQLQRGISIESPSDIEQQGIIQSFEFTFDQGAVYPAIMNLIDRFRVELKDEKH